jgi:hypothetical protein
LRGNFSHLGVVNDQTYLSMKMFEEIILFYCPAQPFMTVPQSTINRSVSDISPHFARRAGIPVFEESVYDTGLGPSAKPLGETFPPFSGRQGTKDRIAAVMMMPAGPAQQQAAEPSRPRPGSQHATE